MSGSQGSGGRRSGRALVVVIVVAAVLIVVSVAVAVAAVLDRKNVESAPTTPVEELAEQSERVDLDESSGVAYVNNEVIVYLALDANADDAARLFSSVGASDVDDTMADIGLYRLVFPDAMSHEELTSVVATLSESPLVSSASLDPVIMPEEDAEDSGELEPADARTPNDPWNNASWDVDRPRDENWGMEAIDAPGAWGYLDRLETTRVGLIDSVPDTSHEDLSDELVSSTYLVIDTKTGALSTASSATADDHGSHVAGIIGADWDNDKGVSGVMGDKGDLYYCGAFYSDGKSRYGTGYTYLLQLKNLIDQDVRAINISQNTSRLIGYAASHGNQNAINHLQQQANVTGPGLQRIIDQRRSSGEPDFVICISAGNSNSTKYYPDASQTYGYRESPTFWERLTFQGEKGGSLAIYNNFLALMDEADVLNRVIVVGSVGIDGWGSLGGETRYAYSSFSCVGDRVDVVAPGEDVYSCVVGDYDSLSGTSMSSPHVTGVAGLVFAANPELSGPDVKRILIASTEGRYYYGSDYSGLVNAKTAVESALRTRDESVSRVVVNQATNGLDLCFVVDTTGSMGDDIENARENMEQILSSISERTENYRIALVDYRDFSSRTHDDDDYPCQVQLDFTNDNAAITAAIDQLDLGYGGDDEETVYSALMRAVELEWRDDAKKVVIILGDAAPLDPEPMTGYTYQDILMALFNGGIGIDYTSSDSRVLGEPSESLISVFSIGADASSDAMDFFDDISYSTGGDSADIDDASGVSDAITDSIEQIEVQAGVTADLSFGSDMAGHRVDLYAATSVPGAVTGAGTDETSQVEKPEAGSYLFSFTTDDSGRFTLEALPAGSYVWTTDGPAGGGTLSVATGGVTPALNASGSFWFSPITRAWDQAAPLFVSGLLVLLALCVVAPIVVAHLAAKPAAPTPGPGGRGGARHCPHCGGEVPDGARFCRSCGKPIG